MSAATPEQLARVTHHISNDEMSLRSTYHGPEGVIASTIGWPDVGTAREHYADAAHSFLRHLPELIAKADTGMEPGTTTRQRLFRAGPLDIVIDAGPPIWLLPKVLLRDSKGQPMFAVGWLYRAVHFTRRTKP